jgi:hypothetical protein
LHHALGDRARADLHAESAYEHEQRAAEHGEQAYRSSLARDEDERDDSRNENLDRLGRSRERSPRRDEQARAAFEDEVEPIRFRSSANLDRRDDFDYGVNGRSESTGTAREDS